MTSDPATVFHSTLGCGRLFQDRLGMQLMVSTYTVCHTEDATHGGSLLLTTAGPKRHTPPPPHTHYPSLTAHPCPSEVGWILTLNGCLVCS